MRFRLAVLALLVTPLTVQPQVPSPMALKIDSMKPMNSPPFRPDFAPGS